MLLYIYRLPIWQTLLFLLLAAVFWVLMGGLLDSALPWGRRIWRSGCGVLAGVWLLAVLQATIFSRSPGAYEVCLAPLEQLRQALRGGNRELLRSAWMNVLLFIPGGLSLAELLPVRWSAKRRFQLALGGLVLFSVGIEAVQWHWRLGQAETDDCLANALGAVLGLLLFRLRLFAAAWIRNRKNRPPEAGRQNTLHEEVITLAEKHYDFFKISSASSSPVIRTPIRSPSAVCFVTVPFTLWGTAAAAIFATQKTESRTVPFASGLTSGKTT